MENKKKKSAKDFSADPPATALQRIMAALADLGEFWMTRSEFCEEYRIQERYITRHLKEIAAHVVRHGGRHIICGTSGVADELRRKIAFAGRR